MAQIFISYSREYIIFAERLARDLQDAGLDVWVDFRNIKGGDAWRDEIFKGISASNFMIVCLTPNAVESEWVRREILMTSSQHKLIIPVMVEDCFDLMSNHDETRGLLDIQAIDFENLGYEKAFPLLLDAIPGLRKVVEDVGEIDPADIPNPFKGLEAFQQTDADIFFGREDLTGKLLDKLRPKSLSDRPTRFLAVVGPAVVVKVHWCERD